MVYYYYESNRRTVILSSPYTDLGKQLFREMRNNNVKLFIVYSIIQLILASFIC